MYDTFKRIDDLNERKQLQCNRCKRETIHTAEARCRGEWSAEHYGGRVNGGSDYTLFRCGACDAVCFERDSWDDESLDFDEYGNMIAARSFEQYPPPSSADFSFDTSHVPRRLSDLIDEMMYSLAGGKLNLATIGLRLVVEYIASGGVATRVSLAKLIDEMCATNGIDDAHKALLHTIRTKGNAGAHKGKPMNKEEMIAGMSVVALLLEKLFNGPARHADAIAKAQKAFKDKDEDDMPS